MESSCKPAHDDIPFVGDHKTPRCSKRPDQSGCLSKATLNTNKQLINSVLDLNPKLLTLPNRCSINIQTEVNQGDSVDRLVDDLVEDGEWLTP